MLDLGEAFGDGRFAVHRYGGLRTSKKFSDNKFYDDHSWQTLGMFSNKLIFPIMEIVRSYVRGRSSRIKANPATPNSRVLATIFVLPQAMKALGCTARCSTSWVLGGLFRRTCDICFMNSVAAAFGRNGFKEPEMVTRPCSPRK